MAGLTFLKKPAAKKLIPRPRSLEAKSLAFCLKITGSFPAAHLLYRIAYWWPKATIRRNGHTWIAKSAAEWCQETKLTLKQYRSAITRLRQLGLVATERHKFGKEHKNITHLRLNEDEKIEIDP